MKSRYKSPEVGDSHDAWRNHEKLLCLVYRVGWRVCEMRLWRKKDTKQRLTDWKSIVNFAPREMAAMVYTIFMEVS